MTLYVPMTSHPHFFHLTSEISLDYIPTVLITYMYISLSESGRIHKSPKVGLNSRLVCKYTGVYQKINDTIARLYASVYLHG